MSKPFFHEEATETLVDLIKGGITIGELNEKYSQPDWCNYEGALNGRMGCWSLMDIKDLRLKISEDFCKTCPDFNYKREGVIMSKPL